MEENTDNLKPKKSKWWIWVLIMIVVIVIAFSVVYIWANRPYEKTIDSDSVVKESEV